MNKHAPIQFGRNLSDATLERISGVKVYKPEEVPFFGAGQKVNRVPALKFRPSETPGGEGTWQLVDALTKSQRIAHGRRKSRVRISTGCRESDRDGAAEVVIQYQRDKRMVMLAHVIPGEIPISAILLAYDAHLVGGAHNLKAGTVRTYRQKLVPLGEFFGATPLGALTPDLERDYEEWRAGQTVRDLGDKAVTASEIGHEIGMLRRAINHFRQRTQVNLNIVHYVPERDTPPVTWWRRHEMARFLWACRGRISVPARDEAGDVVGQRWMVMRDLDPTLAGPEGDRRVLRPRAEVERRKPVARWARLGIHAPSRAQVMIQAMFRESATNSYVSLVEGALRRKPIGPDKSNKRRPPAPLGPKLTHLVVCWGRDAVKPNAYRRRPALHLLHQPNGEPCGGTVFDNIRKQVLKDCGVAKTINSSILRHTSAMWMKIEGVSLWIAADRLGISARVCEERYGTWDNLSTYEATQALCRGTRQKAAMRMAEAEGVMHMM